MKPVLSICSDSSRFMWSTYRRKSVSPETEELASHHPHDLYGTASFTAKLGRGAGRFSGRSGQARRLESDAPNTKHRLSLISCGCRTLRAAALFRMACTAFVMFLGGQPNADFM